LNDEKISSSRFEKLIAREEENKKRLLIHLENGVEFYSFSGIFIDEEVSIQPGATILPGTFLKGNTSVGAGSTIGPNSMLENATIGENSEIKNSYLYDCKVGDEVKIGPFVHIRPDSDIHSKVKIGDFVEVKNSTIGEGTSVAHLTYIGDSDVGRHCNFGCGVVTVNYDGEQKMRTTIGDFVFVGCNANLISPVSIGEGAYIAAGSTVTKDVPPGALGIARARQENKEGWADVKLADYKRKHGKE
jgi:N-acetylglucosamine-1-phosphate uridyltransferase (contains nucleotidyltransferase and I-patch acetyltransferase domains)